MSGFNSALMSNKFQVSGLPTTFAVDGSFGGAGATGQFFLTSRLLSFFPIAKGARFEIQYKNSKIRAEKEAKQGLLIKVWSTKKLAFVLWEIKS